MTDWDEYARSNPITESTYRAEETQWLRVQKLLDRCVGSVLDVGGGDGWIARQLMDRGHEVLMLEASSVRCARAAELGVTGFAAVDLARYPDASWSTVLLGEVLEHLDDPGETLHYAFRIASERVVISLPLQGWVDPTHVWRVSMDHFSTPNRSNDGRPLTSEQIIVTMQRGACAPFGYMDSDEKWKSQFLEGK